MSSNTFPGIEFRYKLVESDWGRGGNGNEWSAWDTLPAQVLFAYPRKELEFRLAKGYDPPKLKPFEPGFYRGRINTDLVQYIDTPPLGGLAAWQRVNVTPVEED